MYRKIGAVKTLRAGRPPLTRSRSRYPRQGPRQGPPPLKLAKMGL